MNFVVLARSNFYNSEIGAGLGLVFIAQTSRVEVSNE